MVSSLLLLPLHRPCIAPHWFFFSFLDANTGFLRISKSPLFLSHCSSPVSPEKALSRRVSPGAPTELGWCWFSPHWRLYGCPSANQPALKHLYHCQHTTAYACPKLLPEICIDFRQPTGSNKRKKNNNRLAYLCKRIAGTADHTRTVQMEPWWIR